MNKLLKYSLVGFAGLGVLGAILPDPATLPQEEPASVRSEPVAAVKDNSEQIAAVETALKAEPKIKDMARQGAYWNIGLINDGTPRYGYAEYVCNVIREGGAMNSDGQTIVRTIDIVRVAKFGDSFRSASMGAVNCADFSYQEK